MNRQQRRHPQRHQPRVQPVLIGDGVIASAIRDHAGVDDPAVLARLLGREPPALDGRLDEDRIAGFVASEETVAGSRDPDVKHLLDHESLWSLTIGCWDCEQPLGVIEPGSVCTAPGSGDT